MAADLVVVNHHLFFADMALRDTGVAELLPSVEVAVFDEAHQLAEAGVQFLGTMLGTVQMLDFARDLLGVGLQQARGLAPWQDLAAGCERAARELRLAAAGASREVRGTLKLRWNERSGRAEFAAALADVAGAGAAALQALEHRQRAVARLHEAGRARHAAGAAGRAFRRPLRPSDSVRWIDVVAAPGAPGRVAAGHSRSLARADGAESEGLGVHLGHARRRRAAALVHRVGRPGGRADAARGQPVRLCRPTRVCTCRAAFPKPNEPSHATEVARAGGPLRAWRWAAAAFVLTTTLRALQAIGEQLLAGVRCPGRRTSRCCVQGQAPKRQLMQQFLAEPRSVLVGSQSFWEGIDVPGDALQCVLIDKLPFPPPNDPLVEARVQRLEAEGRNAFADYFVAEAAVSLKQGAGRLIRSETDRGLLVVCDPRLAAMDYGAGCGRPCRRWAGLPPRPRHSAGSVSSALARAPGRTEPSALNHQNCHQARLGPLGCPRRRMCCSGSSASAPGWHRRADRSRPSRS